MKKQERYDLILARFRETMPIAESELNFRNNFQLIVAVILSAQCTDKRVNMITPALFERFPNAKAMAAGSVGEIYRLIKSCTYPNSKAEHLLAMARMLEAEFGGVVPDSREELMRLPGVGRKTANVVLAVGFGKSAIAVDTHVFRVSSRLGLTTGAKTPLDTERQLSAHISAELQGTAHHWLLLHGRYTCTARNPKCEECVMKDLCKHYRRHE